MAFTPLDPVADDDPIEVEWGNKVVTAMGELQVAATELQSDMLDAEGRLDALEVTNVGCTLLRAASATATAGLSSVTWDTELDDTSGFISVPGINITIPSGLGGLYSVSVNIVAGTSWAAGTYLRINHESDEWRFPAVGTIISGSVKIPMSPTDVVSVSIQNTGVSSVAYTGKLFCYR